MTLWLRNLCTMAFPIVQRIEWNEFGRVLTSGRKVMDEKEPNVPFSHFFRGPGVKATTSWLCNSRTKTLPSVKGIKCKKFGRDTTSGRRKRAKFVILGPSGARGGRKYLTDPPKKTDQISVPPKGINCENFVAMRLVGRRKRAKFAIFGPSGARGGRKYLTDPPQKLIKSPSPPKV